MVQLHPRCVLFCDYLPKLQMHLRFFRLSFLNFENLLESPFALSDFFCLKKWFLVFLNNFPTFLFMSKSIHFKDVIVITLKLIFLKKKCLLYKSNNVYSLRLFLKSKTSRFTLCYFSRLTSRAATKTMLVSCCFNENEISRHERLDFSRKLISNLSTRLI